MTVSLLEQVYAIEKLLVARNPRGMDTVRQYLQPGYLLRAAQHLLAARGPIGLLTGFPINDTWETDGPAGLLALQRALERAGADTIVWIDKRMDPALFADTAVSELPPPGEETRQSRELGALVIIERPGASSDGKCYNIRGEDISARCVLVEPFIDSLSCPIIAIGDGGNEVGMGRAGEALSALPIVPAASSCDELVVADVSNWAAYALAALIDCLSGAGLDNEAPSVAARLDQLITAGAVDGVTGAATATEDNFPACIGDALINEIRGMLAASDCIQFSVNTTIEATTPP